MAEHHDNTKPAANGSFSLNKLGVYTYFPIEKADKLKPFLALCIMQRLDGTIAMSIDMRFSGQIGEIDDD